MLVSAVTAPLRPIAWSRSFLLAHTYHLPGRGLDAILSGNATDPPRRQCLFRRLPHHCALLLGHALFYWHIRTICLGVALTLYCPATPRTHPGGNACFGGYRTTAPYCLVTLFSTGTYVPSAWAWP